MVYFWFALNIIRIMDNVLHIFISFFPFSIAFAFSLIHLHSIRYEDQFIRIYEVTPLRIYLFSTAKLVHIFHFSFSVLFYFESRFLSIASDVRWFIVIFYKDKVKIDFEANVNNLLHTHHIKTDSEILLGAQWSNGWNKTILYAHTMEKRTSNNRIEYCRAGEREREDERERRRIPICTQKFH